MEILRFVIVGHVDHGKSTLIGRLLYDTGSISPDKIKEVRKVSAELGRETEFAYLLDHLEEERQQGITIDTTQVFFKSHKRRYVIIDAPGHVEFVKNMITGASQAEAAILIVDAKEGIKEQTRRHVYILSMLGLKDVVVVFNKMDLVGFGEETFNTLKEETEEFMESTNIAVAFYVPVSAKKGDNVANRSGNMHWYKGPTILESLDLLKAKTSQQDKFLIFPVQDVYTIDSKRIAVGRIEGGTIKVGQEIKILPDGKTTRVKSIEKFLEKKDVASTGESIGITTYDPVFLDRGNIICEDEKDLYLTDTLYANVFWLAKDNLDIKEVITMRCATQEVFCKVEHIEKRINSSTLEVIEENASFLKNLEIGKLKIKTKRSIAVKEFREARELGRFVFVKRQNICAGGIVTGVD